ncbi:MAG TPA: ATP-dependent RNA helicase HrpA [Mycobacteriales bacterium]|nr:ATP-dependent RNA helicase HrpA [Mycobacteriales bacterium]
MAVTGRESAPDLDTRLAALMLRDEHLLRRRFDGQGPSSALHADIEKAEERIARRRSAVPKITYPAELPVSGRRDDIVAALQSSQVLVVAGETGSGKTTQLPKMCLEAGRGVRGLIGHTQPRRIAARAVAERIATELGEADVGDVVGYQVRFTDRSSDDTLIKVMTDGILLAELQHDRMLRRYDTVIVDEAHERSLNIDFLLGYLAQLLPRRPDLSLVITSATIDTGRFAAHFGDAPIVEVSGRTYPVEVRYSPPAEDVDQVQAITDAAQQLCAEGPGDLLVFLSGEREIRDTADALMRLELPSTEVLPLYARLSAAEQHRVFAAHSGRRIVLATNVAETSLTVPGIRYVIDPGTARISRYSARTKVQRLPIERISKASAEQRKGRCGRVADGVCVRLYDEEDFASRPDFTDPEILRTHLASVILAMTSLGLGDIAAFPFVDAPDRRGIRDGLDLLVELGAIELVAGQAVPQLTAVGRRLARLPVDPRLGRMVLEASAQGCLHDVLVIAAALSIQDPRERPADKQQAADELHARFRDEHSDFAAILTMWRYLQEKQAELSSSAFRRMCKAEFLHYLRVREWQDLHGQLRQAAKSAGLVVPSAVTAEHDSDAVHRSLLAGLLSQIGLKDGTKPDYVGARSARFRIGSGSALAKKAPRWVMAAELVETSRLWARTVARIDPAWVEPLAEHLVVRIYSEPHWDAVRGAVMGFERVTLYGLPIVTRRRIGYATVDAAVARSMFIRHALVEGDWRTHHQFLADNASVLEGTTDLEHRLRRRDLVVDDQTLVDFYDARLPDSVVSGRHFDAWWKSARRADPDLLALSRESLLTQLAGAFDPNDYPDVWTADGGAFDVEYRYDPGADHDGVTVQVPLALLSSVDPDPFTWQVPGLRHELVTALIRSLPKALRVRLVPAPDVARSALATMSPTDGPLIPVLTRALHRLSGTPVPADAWRSWTIPPYLRVRFAVIDADGTVLESSRDLPELQSRLAPRVRRAVASAAGNVERTGLTSWLVGTIPQVVAAGQAQGYPALVDEGETVALRVLASAADQARMMWRGTRRLLLLSVGSPTRAVVGRLPKAVKLALPTYRHGTVAELLSDCVDAAVDALMADAGGPAWDEAGFTALRDAVRGSLQDEVFRVVVSAGQVLSAGSAVSARLDALGGVAVAQEAVADVRAQLDQLIGRGFVTLAGRDRLGHLLRYVEAAQRRLDKLPAEADRDRARLREVVRVIEAWAAAGRPADVRWMIEELRVSLFAQSLGTAHPVSEKRILQALDDL